MKKTTLATIIGIGYTAVTRITSAPAMADPGPVAGHPRVTQVNGRRANQDNRIGWDYRHHDLTNCQARNLRFQERAIGSEERDMRAMDGGHLTRADQRSLNQQLNTDSGDIYRAAHQSN